MEFTNHGVFFESNHKSFRVLRYEEMVDKHVDGKFTDGVIGECMVAVCDRQF